MLYHLIMNNQNLSLAFKRIYADLPLAPYLQEICDGIAGGKTDKKDVDKSLISYGVNRSVATVDFLNLIFAYIKIALEDEVLTEEEKDNIRFLKNLFQIQPGDFYYHNKLDVDKTIMDQLSKIYADDFITEEEAELKSAIQEVFDLTYDQMNDYAKIKAAVSIKKGADPKDLDIVFTYEEYFKLRPQ